MSRLSRKNRKYSQLKIKTSGGMTDLIDNVFKETWRINDEEYDRILNKMTDEEMLLFLTENPTFKQKKQIITLVERLLNPEEWRDDQINKIL